MLLAIAFFSVMDSCMKLLSARYPSIQITAMRALSSLPLVMAYVSWRGAWGSLWRIRWGLHVLRGILGIAMLWLFTFALHRLPLSETYTLFFIGPALIAGLSGPLLHERVSRQRWIAIVIGLVGVLVVLRPSTENFVSLGGLATLGAALFYAISSIAVRILGKTDSSESMVFWVMLMMATGAGVVAYPGWVAIESQDWFTITVMAMTGFVGQLSVTHAFKNGEASAIAPLEYSALAWGLAIDWLLWRTLPDYVTITGAAIIVASGIYLVRHEAEHAEAEHP